MSYYLCDIQGVVLSFILQLFYLSVASESFKQDNIEKDIISTISVLSENGTTFNKSVIQTIKVSNQTKSLFNNFDKLNTSRSLPDWMRTIESGALQRTGYVVLGIMLIILIFFAVRSIRLHNKRSKSRKYGIIVSNASDMEMEPLDRNEDDEEEMTLFDAQHKHFMK